MIKYKTKAKFKYQKGGKVDWGREFQDFGSRMLHGLQTFGGSYVGDAIQGVSPKAADYVSQYTAGLISPTPESYLEKNRSGIKEQLGSAANTASIVLGAEMAGPLLGKIAGKFKEAIPKAQYNRQLNIPFQYPASKKEIQAGIDEGVKWFENWTAHPEFKARAYKMGIRPEHELHPGVQLRQRLNKDIFNTSESELVTLSREAMNKKPNLVYIRENVAIPQIGKTRAPEVRGVSQNSGDIVVSDLLSSKQDAASTTVHEMAHSKFFNRFPPVESNLAPKKLVPTRLMEDLFGTGSVSAKQAAQANKYVDYVRNPTETYARVMQARHDWGLQPGKKIDDALAKVLYESGESGFSTVHPLWFKQINGPAAFKKMLNTFPILGGAAIVTKSQDKK